MRQTVTPVAWHHELYQYGAPDTYRLAADWLKDCATVADWGGACGCFQSYLPETVRYTIVDGTVQAEGQVLADLRAYHEPSEGIMLRHVIDNTHDWYAVLSNALQAFRRRLVVVTFTPDAETITRRVERKSGWPTWLFDPNDLRRIMGDLLVRDARVETTHPERVYYLERPCA